MPLLSRLLCGCVALHSKKRGEEEELDGPSRLAVSRSLLPPQHQACCPASGNRSNGVARTALLPLTQCATGLQVLQVPTFQQAPMQPESPPVKARALPEQCVPAVSLHATTLAAPCSPRQAAAVCEQEEERQLRLQEEQQEQQQQETQRDVHGAEAPASIATAAIPNEPAPVHSEGSEPDALSLLPSGEPPQVGQLPTTRLLWWKRRLQCGWTQLACRGWAYRA